jgi:long-subunit acyl-CoA synthetase (AMP-forming)
MEFEKLLHKNTLQKQMLFESTFENECSKDDKIAIISTNNRTEWNIMDIGVLQTGAQTVPIYPTISEDDYDIS